MDNIQKRNIGKIMAMISQTRPEAWNVTDAFEEPYIRMIKRIQLIQPSLKLLPSAPGTPPGNTWMLLHSGEILRGFKENNQNLIRARSVYMGMKTEFSRANER